MSDGTTESGEIAPRLVDDIPLIVGLDGTLIKSGLLIKSLFKQVGSRPASLFGLLSALCHGKANLKEVLAREVDLDIATLPFDETRSRPDKGGPRAQGRSRHRGSAL